MVRASEQEEEVLLERLASPERIGLLSGESYPRVLCVMLEWRWELLPLLNLFSRYYFVVVTHTHFHELGVKLRAFQRVGS